MIPSNHRSKYISIIMDLKNDNRFDDIVFRQEIDEVKPIIIAKDNKANNTVIVSFSGGTNSFKIEHWADIPHTAFNLGQPQELVLTSFIELNEDYINKIKDILLKAFEYESAYLQWRESDKYKKIKALPFETTAIGSLHDDQVLVSVKETDIYVVTNKFHKTLSFNKEDFFKRFEF